MHVLLTSIPCYGHFMPLKAVAEELLILGHDVTLFVEPHLKDWCTTDATREAGGRKFGCVFAPSSGLFGPELFIGMSAHEDIGSSFNAIFDEVWRHHESQLGAYLRMSNELNATNPITLVLTDMSTLVGYAVAAHLDVPYVSMFPLSMHMPLGPATYLPSLGTAFPKDGRMTVAQRFVNFALKLALAVVGSSMLHKLDAVRIANGVRPVHAQAEVAGMKSLILAPTIWGLDIPQPLCPNIVPLGVLSPRHGHEALEEALSTFLGSATCTELGAIYVNFGTLAVLSNQTFANVWTALREMPNCVVWKIREADREKAVQAELSAAASGIADRFYLARRFANPVAIMTHPTVKAFITHCGDTSVLEAIESLLPVAGIPIFADQADVCMRVQESGIGRYVGHKSHFTPADLLSAVAEVVGPKPAAPRITELDAAAANASPNQFIRRLYTVRAVSRSLGGPKRGAAVIADLFARGLLRSEASAAADGGFLDFPLSQCQTLTRPFLEREGSVWRLAQLDVIFGQVAVIVALLIVAKLALSRIVRRVTRRNGTAGSGTKPPGGAKKQKGKLE